jgi:hypothetical protein
MPQHESKFKGGFRLADYYCGRCHNGTGSYVATAVFTVRVPKPQPDKDVLGFHAITVSIECCENCCADVIVDADQAIQKLADGFEPVLKKLDLSAIAECKCSGKGSIRISGDINFRVAKRELRPALSCMGMPGPNDPARISPVFACQFCFTEIVLAQFEAFAQWAAEHPRFDSNRVQGILDSGEFPYCGRITFRKGTDDE